ncbi:MAG: hypothetical protein QHJ81_06820 [Anaerolineae bacterium]|nr:hypothetical protein [Anaerolineae bacterium]
MRAPVLALLAGMFFLLRGGSLRLPEATRLPAPPPGTPAQPGASSRHGDGDSGDADDFLIGIGYTTANLAATYADLGARQAKCGYYTNWEDIEPDPPENGVHTYYWDGVDATVSEYQAHGFSEIHLTLQSKSSWGTEGGCDIFQCRPSLPKPGHWADYEAYVRAVVERYDADGVDDMPGLRYPVRQYEIETEADDWWPAPCPEDPDDPDRASTYLQLLEAAQRAAREAYPDVQILPGAMLFYGLFSGEPDEATIAARRAAYRTVDCIVTFNEEVLRHPELFDAVEFHFLGDDYREIVATIRWLRAQMRANGYEKPIYPSDIPTAPALVPTGAYPETFLYPQEVVKGYLDIIHENIASDTPSQEYLDIRAWYSGEQAEFTVKLLLTAMAEGAAGMQLASMTDFPWLLLCTPTWWYNYYTIWNWGLHGMVEVDWGPFFGCFPLGYQVRGPRPVFHTLRWLIAHLPLSPSHLVPLSPDHSPSPSVELYAYRVQAEERAVYVLWSEDGVGQVMGEIEPSVTVTLPVASSVVTVTHVITQTGQAEPSTEVVEVTDGRVVLKVGETPVFVEETPVWRRLYLPLAAKGSG